MKGSSVLHASSPPPQHWVFRTATQTQFQRKEPVGAEPVRALGPAHGGPPWCRCRLCTLLPVTGDTARPWPLTPALALTVLHPVLSSPRSFHAPCPCPPPHPGETASLCLSFPYLPGPRLRLLLIRVDTQRLLLCIPLHLPPLPPPPTLVSLHPVAQLSPGPVPGAQHLGLGQEEARTALSSYLINNE